MYYIYRRKQLQYKLKKLERVNILSIYKPAGQVLSLFDLKIWWFLFDLGILGCYCYCNNFLKKSLSFLLGKTVFVKNKFKFCQQFHRRYIVSNFYNFSVLRAFERGFFPEVIYNIIAMRVTIEQRDCYSSADWYLAFRMDTRYPTNFVAQDVQQSSTDAVYNAENTGWLLGYFRGWDMPIRKEWGKMSDVISYEEDSHEQYVKKKIWMNPLINFSVKYKRAAKLKRYNDFAYRGHVFYLSVFFSLLVGALSSMSVVWLRSGLRVNVQSLLYEVDVFGWWWDIVSFFDIMNWTEMDRIKLQYWFLEKIISPYSVTAGRAHLTRFYWWKYRLIGEAKMLGYDTWRTRVFVLKLDFERFFFFRKKSKILLPIERSENSGSLFPVKGWLTRYLPLIITKVYWLLKYRVLIEKWDTTVFLFLNLYAHMLTLKWDNLLGKKKVQQKFEFYKSYVRSHLNIKFNSVYKRYRWKYYYLCFLLVNCASTSFTWLGSYFVWALRGELVKYVPTKEELMSTTWTFYQGRKKLKINFRNWKVIKTQNQRRVRSRDAAYGWLFNWFRKWMSSDFFSNQKLFSSIEDIKKDREVRVMWLNSVRTGLLLFYDVHDIFMKLRLGCKLGAYELRKFKFLLLVCIGTARTVLLKDFFFEYEPRWKMYYDIQFQKKVELINEDKVANVFFKKKFVRRDVDYSVQKRFYRCSHFYLGFNVRIKDSSYKKDMHSGLFWWDKENKIWRIEHTVEAGFALIERGLGWEKFTKRRYPPHRIMLEVENPAKLNFLIDYGYRIRTFGGFIQIVNTIVNSEYKYNYGPYKYLFKFKGYSWFMTRILNDIKLCLYSHSDQYLNFIFRNIVGRYYILLRMEKRVKNCEISMEAALVDLFDEAPVDISKINAAYRMSRYDHKDTRCYDFVSNSIFAYERYLKDLDTRERKNIIYQLRNNIEFKFESNPYFIFELMRFRLKCGLMLVLASRDFREICKRKRYEYSGLMLDEYSLHLRVSSFDLSDWLGEAWIKFGIHLELLAVSTTFNKDNETKERAVQLFKNYNSQYAVSSFLKKIGGETGYKAEETELYSKENPYSDWQVLHPSLVYMRKLDEYMKRKVKKNQRLKWLTKEHIEKKKNSLEALDWNMKKYPEKYY